MPEAGGWALREPLASSEGAPDCANLQFLNEPSLLENLQERYAQGHIYTRAGEILIAVNPYKELYIYGDEARARYVDFVGDSDDANAPHVYFTAMAAFRAMMRDSRGQSVLVSGESGAGKTESTKLIMRFLSSVAGHDASGAADVDNAALSSSLPPDSASVCERVLATNPVLEAFGNAKTVRNDNSSRFGKYVELRFDRSGFLTGAHIRTYLLERSRVVRPPRGERTYHAFYQAAAGGGAGVLADSSVLKEGGAGTSPAAFKVLHLSGCDAVKGLEDSRELKQTLECMETLGIAPSTARQVFRALWGLLHLSNVELVRPDDASEETPLAALDRATLGALDMAAAALGCDPDALGVAISSRKIHAAGEVYTKQLRPDDAVLSRESLSKVLYCRLFGWIVARLNAALRDTSLGAGSQSALNLPGLEDGLHERSTIGILDIYGFESFDVNSLEQLCINYANEHLQALFNEFVFKVQQEEYLAEGICWESIAWPDNSDVINLIERGILPLLDDGARISGNDESFVAALLAADLPTARFREVRRARHEQFCVVHFAGIVTYSATGFLSKNKEYTIAEHAALLRSCTLPILGELFNVAAPGSADANGGAGDGTRGDEGDSGSGRAPQSARGGSNKFTSVCLSFKTQLRELMRSLASTDPHFVRCIKPNCVQAPGLFEAPLVLDQLRSGGVLEAVRVMQAGFPARRAYAAFADRYRVLMTGAAAAAPGEVPRDVVEGVMASLGLHADAQFGRTKVFLRAGHLPVLETALRVTLHDAVLRIQAHVRGARRRRDFLALCAASRLAQRRWRGVLGRRVARNAREQRAAVIIQRCLRAAWCARRVRAATRIQAMWRMSVQRRASAATLQAILILQAAWRARFACAEARGRRVALRETAAAVTQANGLRAELEAERERGEALAREVAALTAALEAASAAAADTGALDAELRRRLAAEARADELENIVADANRRAELAAQAAASAAGAYLGFVAPAITATPLRVARG